MREKKVGTIKAEITWIPISGLVSDPKVQRALISARLKHLTRHFDSGGLGVITVSLRSDRKYYILDGQHRVEAARRSGHGSMKVKCHVYRDLTLQQEAQQFLLLNDARAVSAIDKFNIGLVAGDPTCVGTDKIFRRYGLRVDNNIADGNIGCVDKALKLYARDPALLEQTLALTTGAWGTRRAAVEQLVLTGLSTVIQRYDGELDRTLLKNKLSKYKGGPGGLIGDARALSDIKPVNKTRAFAEIVVDTYNKGRRGGSLSPL